MKNKKQSTGRPAKNAEEPENLLHPSYNISIHRKRECTARVIFLHSLLNEMDIIIYHVCHPTMSRDFFLFNFVCLCSSSHSLCHQLLVPPHTLIHIVFSASLSCLHKPAKLFQHASTNYPLSSSLSEVVSRVTADRPPGRECLALNHGVARLPPL